MIIRRATIKDLPQISRLSLDLFKYERAFTKTYDLTWTYSKIGQTYFTDRLTKKNGIVFVAEDKGKVVGYICGYIGHWYFRLNPKMAEIDNMFVLPKYRRQGIGSQLIQAFIQHLKEIGANRVKVEALYTNMLTKDFYQKNHFHPHSIFFEQEL